MAPSQLIIESSSQPKGNPLDSIEQMANEKLQMKIALKEVSTSQNVQGDLFITNFKLLFKPQGVRIEDCGLYSVPYGAIQRLVESSNTDRLKCAITIFCKDERFFKFKFDNSALAFGNTVKAIKKYSMCQTVDQLYCSQWQGAEMLSWNDVHRVVHSEFERLGITREP